MILWDDTVGRRMSISNSYGTVEMAYNSRNFVTSRTDGEGYTSHKFYDRMGNLTAYYPPVQWEKKEGGYEYRRNFLERVVDTISPLQEHQRVFRNFDGDITNKIHPVSYAEKGDDGEGTRYEYDADGNCIRIYYPDGGVERRFYDADGILGRRSHIYNDEGLEVRYGYDALNRISKIHYGNGVETSYTYDGEGNISSLETKAGEKILLSFAYQYDGNGNRTAKVGTQASASTGGIIYGIISGNNALDISYNYDVRGQLLEERRNGASVSYAYDKAGNRVRKTDAKGATLYRFNRKNQLIEAENHDGKKQFTYDRQGGIVEEKNVAGIRLFSYNGRHQQTKVEIENGNVQENRYDAENLRFELLENGRHISFVYHNGELLHEEGWDENRKSYYLGTGIDALQSGQDLSYYHRDEQLSTAFITGRDGEIQNSYQYDAFGAELEINEQFQNRIRYTGQQYDGLTGQYYLRARYYNPVLGRFMQEDVYQGDICMRTAEIVR